MHPVAILVCVVLTLAGVAFLLASPAVFRHASIFFSVTVPGDFAPSARARKIVRRYRLSLGIAACLAAAMTCFGAACGKPEFIGFAPLVLIAGGIVSFLIARHATLPATAAPAQIAPTPLGKPVPHTPWVPIAVPFLILISTALWLAAHRAAIPARFPVHWGFSGRPDRFAAPTSRSLFGPLVVAGEICVLLGALVWAVGSYAPWRSEWTVRFNRALVRVLVGAVWLVALLLSCIALSPLYGPPPMQILLPLLAAALAALIIPLARVSSSPDAESEATPDDKWAAGIFYFNRRDPALLVQKRFGIGYTFNFAHPVAWVAIALTLLIPITALILL